MISNQQTESGNGNQLKLSEEEQMIYEHMRDKLSSNQLTSNELQELVDIFNSCKTQPDSKNLIELLSREFPQLQKEQSTQIDPGEKMKEALNLLLLPQDKLSSEDFCLIRKAKWENVQKAMVDWEIRRESKNLQSGLFKVILPTIMSRLASAEDFRTLCYHEIFTTKKDSPLYALSAKILLILFLERFPKLSDKFISLYSRIPGESLPFLYFNDTQNAKIPLKSYFLLLSTYRPTIVSLGLENIGKSSLLNRLFFTQFDEHTEELSHLGVDAVFSSEQFQLGYNVYDFQGSFEMYEKFYSEVLHVLPQDPWVLVQIPIAGEGGVNLVQKLLSDSYRYHSQRILIIIRDFSDSRTSLTLQIKLSKLGIPKENVFKISKIQNSTISASSLNTLRESILKLISKNNRLVDGNEILKNSYWPYEDRYNTLKDSNNNVTVSVHSKDFRDFSVDLQERINNESKQKNHHQSLFRVTTVKKKIDYFTEKNKNLSENLTNSERVIECEKNLQEIQLAQSEFEKITPHQLTMSYHILILQKNDFKRFEFENCLTKWQEPLTAPLFEERNEIKAAKLKLEILLERDHANREELQNRKKAGIKVEELKELESELLSVEELKEIQVKFNVLSQDFREVSEKLASLRVNREHFWREIIQFYENQELLNFKDHLKADAFFEAYAHYIKQGGEFELIDGDNNQMMDKSLKALFTKIHPNENEKKECFVVSIIGPQSTGKSTLLNFLFNANFQMSAGRCTQGLYASYFKSDFPNAKDCLVLDSEGLLSVERNDEKFDKKLTILTMAISQVMIINVNGELNEAMKKIISISLFAAKQLQVCINKKPIIFFVLRNMTDTNKKKQVHMIDKIKEEFEEVAKLSKVQFRDIVDYRESDSFKLMYSAYNKDEVGTNLFNACIVNASFRSSCESLRHKIFKEAGNEKSRPFTNFHEFLNTAKNVWQCITTYNDILKLSSIKEINDRNELTEVAKEISQKYIDSNDPENDSTIAKKIDAAITKGKDTDMVRKMIDNYQSEYEELVKDEFNKRTGPLYPRELKNEYEKLLLKRIENITMNGREEWDLRADSRESQLEAEKIFDQLEKFMINQAIGFQLTSQESDTEARVEAYLKHFEEEFKSVGQKYEEKLTQKKKTEEQIINRVYDMMMGICNTQRIEERFLEVGTLGRCRSGSIISQEIDPLNISKHESIIYSDPQFYSQSSMIEFTSGRSLFITPHTSEIEKDSRPNIHTAEDAQRRIGTAEDAQRRIGPTEADALRRARIELNDRIELILKTELQFLSFSSSLNYHQVRAAIQGISNRLQRFEQQALLHKHMSLNMVLMRNSITDYLFREFVKKLDEEEERSHEKAISEYYLKEGELKSTFERKLRATLGDEQMAGNHYHQMMRIMENRLTQLRAKEFLSSIRNNTKYEPEDFDRKINKGIEDFHDEIILKWATDLVGFMKLEFQKEFFALCEKTNNEQEKRYLNCLNNNYQKLKERVKIFEGIAACIESPQNNDDERDSLFFKLFKSFMTSNAADFKLYIQQLKERNIIFKEEIPDYLVSNSSFSEEMIFNQMNLEDKIHNLLSYSGFLFRFFESQGDILKFHSSGYKNHVRNEQKMNELDFILCQNLEYSLGCQHTCPYCGAKCSQMLDHPGHHRATKHRIMGFNGCWQISASSTGKEFLTDICDSTENINESKWKDYLSKFHEKDKHLKKKDIILKEKLQKYGAIIGKLNFSLEWYDPNDLDLYLVCPCGTCVFFNNRKCQSCTAELDVDMNFEKNMDAKTPVEHVRLSTAKTGVYQILVRMFKAKQTYKGITGKDSSSFVLKVHGEDMTPLMVYTDTVNEEQWEKRYEYHCQPGISFNTHCEKHYPDWKISVSNVADSSFNGHCLTAFHKVESLLKKHFELE